VQDPALQERLLSAARAAGDRLASAAVRKGDQVTWVGMTLMDDNYWMLSPLETDLYSGISGVALFLGSLGAATGERRYRDLARGAVKTLLAQVEQAQDRMINIGAFGGWGGIVYAVTRLGVLWEDEALLDAAVGHARRIGPLVAGDIGLDLVNGSAGAILPLLGLHEHRPSAGLLETAIRCGTRLLDTARPMERGVAWETPSPQSRPLCGLSHGVSGMALGLAALGAATGQARFSDGARAALDYEAGLFSAERSNWPDFRYDLFPEPGKANLEEEIGYMTTWCHGAGGVGFARLAMLGSLGDPSLRGDLRAALSVTTKEGFGRSHCLCHGDAGNIELLSESARALGDDSLAVLARQGAAALLEEIAQIGYRCGVPSGVEAPGLMAGIAGIGHGFLRLARPDVAPSVLTLGPASRNSQSASAKIAA
jgi:type 2 lantibiotic biosynthesis protein LanM